MEERWCIGATLQGLALEWCVAGTFPGVLTLSPTSRWRSSCSSAASRLRTGTCPSAPSSPSRPSSSWCRTPSSTSAGSSRWHRRPPRRRTGSARSSTPTSPCGTGRPLARGATNFERRLGVRARRFLVSDEHLAGAPRYRTLHRARRDPRDCRPDRLGQEHAWRARRTALYDVTSGRITLDGQDIRDTTIDSLRRQRRGGFEDPVLFSMSVRENLILGRPDASEKA